MFTAYNSVLINCTRVKVWRRAVFSALWHLEVFSSVVIHFVTPDRCGVGDFFQTWSVVSVRWVGSLLDFRAVVRASSDRFLWPDVSEWNIDVGQHPVHVIIQAPYPPDRPASRGGTGPVSLMSPPPPLLAFDENAKQSQTLSTSVTRSDMKKEIYE